MTELVRGPNVRIAASDWLLIGSVVLAGVVAGTLASGAMYLATPLALLLVYKGAVRHARDSEAGDLYAHPDLPFKARRAVARSAEELPSGEARALLAGVVKQAALLFQARETSGSSTLDDRGLLDEVTELVESACTSAEQLALLDAATRWSTKVNPESRAARQRFVESLSTAAGVIQSLHLAEVNEGTPASDRVRELNSDLRDEASAISRARAELAALLENRRQDSR